jgi:class 3 adenylate cyclase/tetratricopeptide (TPR) repeat protein
MICPKCSTANPAEGRFCLACGAALGGCPSCGAANPTGANFCGTCGTRLGTEVRPAPAGAVSPAAGPVHGGEGPGPTERRIVTVLFADLVGFTSLSATRDPETIRELQDRYFEQTREIVGRYGGVVEKFIGDAVMALWGAPVAQEDDAERAVRAALDLVDMVPVLGRESGVELQIRAGVLTGEAAVAMDADGQGMVTGDMVNTAARLQSAAPPGGVLVGEATRMAAEPAIAFASAGDQELKGKAAPVAAWRAVGVVGERGGARRPDAIEPPFVGRTDEFRFLKEQFHATGRERRARLVSLVGQAGIGKSRLAWELEKYLDGVVEQVWWHRGRSPSYGEGVTFWALGEMLRRRASLAEGDDEETTRRAVAAMVEQHVPDEGERAWIEPRILVLFGIGETPSGGRTELFAAWRTFFERLAGSGTVAFVVEDLQWSDDGLLDFLEHLLDWGRSSPIFVLTLSRPELLERRAGWGTDRRGAISMRLDPLTDAAMSELLLGIAPDLPQAIVARIVDRADGIPLYAVETIRMLVTTGRLAQEDGRIVPTASPLRPEDVGALEVPPTLHALVAARLDRLPAPDRTILQDAAVLGQTFTLEALAMLSGETTDALGPRLASLVRREILTVETDPRAPTRGQHAFVQALVREITYATLARRERRARHLAAARYFETLGDDELAGVVASHFVAAYRASPEGPEGEAVAAQARVSLLAMADRAESLGSLGQATDALITALEVTRDPADHARLLERTGRLQWLNSRYEEAQQNLAAAVEGFTQLDDRVGVIRAVAYRVGAYLYASQIASAIEVAGPFRDEAEALAEAATRDESALSLEAREAAAQFALQLGNTAYRVPDAREAIRWADLALRLAEPLRQDEIVAMALITKGSALVSMGHRREGVALLEGAVIDAQAHGQHAAAIRGTNNLASMTQQDPRGALERVRQGMALARRLGIRSHDGYYAGNAGIAIRLGEWAWLHDALDELVQADPDRLEAEWIASCRDAAAAWTGDPDIARLERLLASARLQNDWQTEMNTSAMLAECAFADGRLEDALSFCVLFLKQAEQDPSPGGEDLPFRISIHAGRLDLARRVLELTDDSRGGVVDHDLATMRAGIAAREGRAGEALGLYRSALAGYREAGCRFDVALVILDMAVLIGPADPAVRALIPEGRKILEELGAVPLLARLDVAEASTAQLAAGSAATRP